MMFFPCVVFGLAADMQIIFSTYKYKPIAFAKMPYPCVRPLMLSLGIISFLLSLITYVFCILVFGGLNRDSDLRTVMFILLMVKAISWSPFLGMEMYDMIFEHVYHDVKFQLNVIKPANSS